MCIVVWCVKRYAQFSCFAVLEELSNLLGTGLSRYVTVNRRHAICSITFNTAFYLMAVLTVPLPYLLRMQDTTAVRPIAPKLRLPAPCSLRFKNICASFCKLIHGFCIGMWPFGFGYAVGRDACSFVLVASAGNTTVYTPSRVEETLCLLPMHRCREQFRCSC